MRVYKINNSATGQTSTLTLYLASEVPANTKECCQCLVQNEVASYGTLVHRGTMYYYVADGKLNGVSDLELKQLLTLIY